MVEPSAQINPARLAQVTRLDNGGHDPTEGQMCAMEDVAEPAPHDFTIKSILEHLHTPREVMAARQAVNAAHFALQDRGREFTDAVRERLSATSAEIGSDFAMLVEVGRKLHVLASITRRQVMPSTAYQDFSRDELGQPAKHFRPTTAVQEAQCAAEGMLDDYASHEALAVVRAAIDLAEAEAVLERMVPPRGPRPVGAALSVAA